MRLWHQLFTLFLGAQSGVGWALAVAFLVLTLRALMIRPFLAQLRSARAARAIAPQLAALRRRHRAHPPAPPQPPPRPPGHRTDPAPLVAKTRELQSRHGVSTWRTFLPALVQ